MVKSGADSQAQTLFRVGSAINHEVLGLNKPKKTPAFVVDSVVDVYVLIAIHTICVAIAGVDKICRISVNTPLLHQRRLPRFTVDRDCRITNIGLSNNSGYSV